MTGKKKTGRPSKWKDEYVKLAFNYCLLGATNEDLAKYFDVTTTTIDKWIKEKPEFSGAIKEGKEEADANVANSLYRRALGYSHKEDKIFNNNGEPLVVPTVKHYAPDPTSAIFWLKNRQRDKWRDKQEIDLNGKMEVEFLMNFGEEDA